MADASAAGALAEATKPPSLLPLLSEISLFTIIADSQSSHGILHQDYAQYHRYCTHRLERLRHHKLARTYLVHNPKYVSASEAASAAAATKKSAKQRRHGYGARLAPPAASAITTGAATPEAEAAAAALEINPPVSSNDLKSWQTLYALTLLYQAERCWAQACAMQQQQGSNASASAKKQSSYNHAHCLRRLHKAAKWSRLLHEWIQHYNNDGISNNNSDEETPSLVDDTTATTLTTLTREAASYAHWMQANAALEQQKFKEALEAYQASMQSLLACIESHASLAAPAAMIQSDVWKTRVASVLQPLVRYCAYQAKVSLTDIDSNGAAAPQVSTDGAAIVVEFSGKEMALDSYKQLVVLYLKLEDSLKRVMGPDTDDGDETRLYTEAEYLQLSCDLDDVLDQVKTEQAYYASLPTGPTVVAKRGDLETLLAYFQFVKLQVWRLQQEERLTTLTDDAELVHAHDILQQNVQAMLELLPSESSSEDDAYWLETQAHVLRIRAFRCYYLARLYESSLDGTPQQCLALLVQSNKLLKRAQEEIGACDDSMRHAEKYLQGLGELAKQIKVMTCRVEATQFLEQESVPYGCKTNRPLWLRLDDLDAGKALCDNPPLPIFMPCKPVFFDIAYQQVGAGDFPVDAIEDFIQAHEPKSGGFLSWFRSS